MHVTMKVKKRTILSFVVGISLIVLSVIFTKLQSSSQVKESKDYTQSANNTSSLLSQNLNRQNQHQNKNTINQANVLTKPDSLEKVIYALNETNPEKSALLLDTQTLDNAFALTLSLVKNWSLQTPSAALDWLEAQKSKFSQSEYQILFRALLKNYALQEPEFVFYQFKDLTTPQLWNELIYDISVGWAHKNVYEAWYWLSELEQENINKTTHHGAYIAVMEIYLQEDPIAASQLIMNSENNHLKKQLIPKTALALATIDLHSALNWIESINNKAWQAAARSALESI